MYITPGKNQETIWQIVAAQKGVSDGRLPQWSHYSGGLLRHEGVVFLSGVWGIWGVLIKMLVNDG